MTGVVAAERLTVGAGRVGDGAAAGGEEEREGEGEERGMPHGPREEQTTRRLEIGSKTR